MARVLFLSPLPPARTGIARYAESVLAGLRASETGRRHALEARWPVDEAAEGEARRARLAVYHVGNNLLFHREIYALACRHPGLVVLHDLALDELVEGLLGEGDPLGPATRAEAEAARGRLRRTGLDLDPPLRVPWCAALARRARGVIVHSEFGRRYLEAFGCRTPVFVVPHPPLGGVTERALRRAERKVRRRLRRGEGPVVGILGDLGRAKGIATVLEAVGRLREPARVALVGRRIPGYDVDAVVAASGLGERVTVATDVPEAEFEAWLRACDVVVNLRYPHRGEVSGTLVRALEAGVPTVVSATGTYLDWPDDVVVRVPGGPPDPAPVAAALERLLGDPGLRARMGEAARTHVRALRDGTVRGYAAAIEGTLALLRDPARAALARWAASLASFGGVEAARRRGLGVRYADALEELLGPRPAGGVPGG